MLYGIQLYSLRNEIEKEGLPTILKKISEIGYHGVEFAGFYNYSPKEIKTMLEENNLLALGIHLTIVEMEKIEEVKEYVEILKVPTITCSYLPEEYRNNMPLVKKILKNVIEVLKDYNVIVSYHNHAFEFENNKNLLLDLINDVNNLNSEPDIFWLSVAGIDPVKFIKENQNKIKIIHIKELGEETFGPSPIIGNGKAKCKEVLKIAKNLNVQYVILESENVGDNYKNYLKECQKVFELYK